MEVGHNKEYEELKAGYLNKKNELLDLLISRDQLKYTDIPNLNAVYMQEFGAILIERLEKEHLYLRLRRKIELIQARLNSSKMVKISEIEETLEKEFRQWQEEIAELIQAKESADKWFDGCLPAAAAGELKLKYREIVKKLHPDLNPGLSKFQIDLWHKTQEAYQDGNIDEIRKIFLVLYDISAKTGIDFVSDVAGKLEQLNSQIAKIKEEIRILHTKFPLNFRAVLDDAVLAGAEKDKIKGNIEEYENKIQILEVQLSNLKLIIGYEQFN